MKKLYLCFGGRFFESQKLIKKCTFQFFPPMEFFLTILKSNIEKRPPTLRCNFFRMNNCNFHYKKCVILLHASEKLSESCSSGYNEFARNLQGRTQNCLCTDVRHLRVKDLLWVHILRQIFFEIFKILGCWSLLNP